MAVLSSTCIPRVISPIHSLQANVPLWVGVLRRRAEALRRRAPLLPTFERVADGGNVWQCECRDCQNNKPAPGDEGDAPTLSAKKRKTSSSHEVSVAEAAALLQCGAAHKLATAAYSATTAAYTAMGAAAAGKMASLLMGDKSNFLLSAPQTPSRAADYHLVVPLTPVEPASTNL